MEFAVPRVGRQHSKWVHVTLLPQTGYQSAVLAQDDCMTATTLLVAAYIITKLVRSSSLQRSKNWIQIEQHSLKGSSHVCFNMSALRRSGPFTTAIQTTFFTASGFHPSGDDR